MSKPREHAKELLEVMRAWVRDNVPANQREATMQHVKCSLFKSLDGKKKP